MADLTADSIIEGQSIVRVFKFTDVDDGETFTGPSSPKAFWAQSTIDPSTNTSAGINVTESSGTYTFYPGVDNATVSLFILL